MLQQEEDQVEAVVDGRVARRERNIETVLAVVIEMFGEDLLMPTIEQVSKRSGLSLRSMYRYFPDPGELHRAAIERHRKITQELSHLAAIGEGPLGERIELYVEMRIRLFAVAAPAFRATLHSAGTNPRVQEHLDRARREQSAQFSLHFAAEATTCNAAVLTAADALSQLDSIDLLRRGHGYSVKATKAAVIEGLRALLSA